VIAQNKTHKTLYTSKLYVLLQCLQYYWSKYQYIYSFSLSFKTELLIVEKFCLLQTIIRLFLGMVLLF